MGPTKYSPTLKFPFALHGSWGGGRIFENSDASTRPSLCMVSPIRYSEAEFRTADGTALAERCWLPEGRPAAVIILVHGFAEHCGRYELHAKRFCEQRFAVEALDLRGHGRSEGPRGYVPSFRTLVDDITAFVKRVLERRRGSRTFLLGHSFGAAIAGLASLRLHDVPIRGLILSSPAVRICEPQWLQRLGLVAARFAPRLPTKRLDRRKLSTDAAYVAAANADPLNYHGLIPTVSAAQIVLAGRALLDRAALLSLPLLIIHGTDDRITMPEASADLYGCAASIDKSLNLYTGMRHETLNEPNGHVVHDRITDFIMENATDAAGP